jgi:putative oxidoreductase
MQAAEMKRPLSLVLRLGLGALFVIAGVLKLRDPAAFATAIANYQLYPQYAAFLAATLPALEIVLGVAVIVAPPRWRAPAGLGILLLTLMFTGAAASALVRKIDIACGCFGTDSGTINAWTMVRDLGLIAAGCAVVALERRAGADLSRPAASSGR